MDWTTIAKGPHEMKHKLEQFIFHAQIWMSGVISSDHVGLRLAVGLCHHDNVFKQ